MEFNFEQRSFVFLVKFVFKMFQFFVSKSLNCILLNIKFGFKFPVFRFEWKIPAADKETLSVKPQSGIISSNETQVSSCGGFLCYYFRICVVDMKLFLILKKTEEFFFISDLYICSSTMFAYK